MTRWPCHPGIPARPAALGALLTLTLALAAAPAAAQAPDASVVYLVRHAEKTSADARDPDLTAAGRVRARELARVLADAGLTDVHSTPFRRTLATAAPPARAAGLEVETYDPGDSASVRALVDHLRTTPGRHLVSGHSNTTPELVAALGGDPGAPIADDEYDRLYVVVIGRDGSVTTLLLRYGARSGG